ncbi:sigma-70 family RNA polymerase sigma factor [Streptomyces sp. DSM 44917]|uniref:Sigma-70 family RNA polymerase sigma factor n=1 Tax=Streptomyces boetiae TaxID=3075541 RepID=A0ABU2L5R2_9ACTN|nr:sigma-70 family RNA polymerase sigma factor [Streptomyces sp. DSM 44917]MDT0306905.1 sigma-70 family RNA polymerase sigma factor [Streptomyces sp. DSM 44917]
MTRGGEQEVSVDEARRSGLLVVRCQLGEREALSELVRVWHAPLWRYVRGLVGSAHVADDVAQDVWVAVVRGLPRLREPLRFAAWLFAIARRAVTDHLRRAYAAEEIPAAAEDAGAAEGEDAPERVLNAMEIEAGLSGLPLREREVLILFHLQDLPLAAVAEVLGVPPGTVKSRLHRARRLLRDVLAERGYEA